MNHSPPGGAKIRRYQNSDRDAFISLNLDWIREYFAVENTDREQLDGLETTILAREGKSVIAELDGQVVGSGAIAPPPCCSKDGIWSSSSRWQQEGETAEKVSDDLSWNG